MSKDYDVAVRWRTGTAAPETTTVHVEATTTAAALKLARRGIYLDHPGAAIDKTEIVYLEKPEKAAAVISLVTPEAVSIHTAVVENDAVEAGFAQPIERDCLRCENTFSASGDEELCPACRRDPNPHVTAVVAATAPEPAAIEVPVGVFARASTLVAQIANRYGTAASTAFLDAMDEFMGSKRANAWTGSRLWITVAKVPELKRKAA